jgi:hypothetical protein
MSRSRDAGGGASRWYHFIPCFRRRRLNPKRHPVPYHASLDTPLLKFGTEFFRARDACESVSILGSPGSGKTTGSFSSILRAYLAAGFAGVYCVAKIDAADEIRNAARATGRLQDIIEINVGEDSARLNLFDYVSRNLGGEGFEQNLIALIALMMETNRKATGTGGGEDSNNKYFSDTAMHWIGHAIPLIRAAWGGTIRIRDLHQFLISVPMTTADASSKEWRTSFCYRTLAKLAELRNQAIKEGRHDARLERVIEEHGDVFLTEVAALDPRPKTSVLSTATNFLSPFLTGKLHDLFATTNSPEVTPEAVREQGKILVLNLPVRSTGAGGIVAQNLVKFLFGLAWQSRPVDARTRFAFIACDEAQFFVHDSDSDLLSTSRSHKMSILYATQDLATYYAKIGNHDVAESILSKFGTFIFHANLSRGTNAAASEMIGKTRQFHVTESRSKGSTSGAGGNRHDHGGGFHGNSGASTGTSQSTSGYMDYEIPPDFFSTRLRTGGPAHRHCVDAIVIRTARTWKKTGRHWTLATFRQPR